MRRKGHSTERPRIGRSVARVAGLLALALVSGAGKARAQGVLPFTVEVRAGPAIPLEQFEHRGTVGYLIGATAKYSPIPFLSAYAGWDVTRFEAEEGAGFPGTDTHVRDSGGRVGAELGVPLAGLMSGVAPYFQAGFSFTRARVEPEEDETGTLSFESKVTRGFELGTGARIFVTRSISVTPEVRYRRTRHEFDEEPISVADELTYLVASLGVNLHF